MSNGVIDITSDSDHDVITISDDEDDEACRFQRDLELAKRLSLAEVSKQNDTRSPVPSTSFTQPHIIQTVVKNLKQRLKLGAASLQLKRNASLKEKELSPPEFKRIKLQNDPELSVKCEQDVSSDDSSDDLPDLEDLGSEDQTPSWNSIKTERSRTSSSESEVILEVQIYDDRQTLDKEESDHPLLHPQLSYDDLSSEDDTDDDFDTIDLGKESTPKETNGPPDSLGNEIKFDNVSESADDVADKCLDTKSVLASSSDKKESVALNILTPEAKNNLANILKKVKSNNSLLTPKKNLVSLSALSRTNSQDSDDPSLSGNSVENGRHFLDFIGSENKSNDDNVLCEKSLQEENSVSLAHNDNDDNSLTDSNDFSPDSNFQKKSRTDLCSDAMLHQENTRYRRKVRLCSSEKSKAAGIRKYFSTNCDSNAHHESEKSVSELALLKPLRIQMPTSDNIDESLASMLSQVHLNTIESCFEEGKEFLCHGLKFISDFLNNYKPPPSVVNDVLHKGLLGSRDTHLMLKSYKILLVIHQKYPTTLVLEWDVVKEVMDELCIGRGLHNQEPILLLMASLFLQLMVSVVEDELYAKNICDFKSFRQTFAYKNISYDCAYLNLKKLIEWTVCCLTCGEYTELQENTNPGQLSSNQENNGIVNDDYEIQRQEIGKILPLLQTLLFLGINISTRCIDCAKTVASELVKSYKYLPSIKHKKLLIETMKSDLLRYHFVSVVLGNYSEDVEPCGEFPLDLQYIFECFFKALQPRYILTPPTTPQSDDEEMDHLPQGAADRVVHFTATAVEEFVMLLYFAVQSYISCKKRKSYTALRRRAHFKAADMNTLSAEDRSQLKNLPKHLEELRGHLLTLTSELSHGTQQYLSMMLCFTR